MMKKSIYFAMILTVLFITVACEKDEIIEPETQVQYVHDTLIVTNTDTVTIIVPVNENDTTPVEYETLPDFEQFFATSTMFDYINDTMVAGMYTVEITKDYIELTINETVHFYNVNITLYNENQGLIKGTIWSDGNTVSGSFMYVFDELFSFDFTTDTENIYGYLLND